MEGRSLEETPTWAVAVVCFVLLSVSIIIEYIFNLIGKWLKKKHKRALHESLEKIKSELMLLGFISLLLTVGQSVISRICISEKVAATFHPCTHQRDHKTDARRLFSDLFASDHHQNQRRLLAAGGTDKCAAQGKVPFVSSEGIHQLHIFIFVLAVFHVLYCILTLALGRAKMRRWKRWEEETKTAQYQFSHDPERFRFARETSFGRRHLSFWTQHTILVWIVCFFRQFVRSVPKVDYLTLRHGFMMAHLGPQSRHKFDFRQYIKRSLEEDFKVVVEISPPIWFITVLFLLFHTHGWYSYLWLPFAPLIIVLLVGTKLQVIITKMGQRIQERGEVVKGVPLVQPGDDLFWFNKPRLILYLVNFVLFQNSFQLAYFSWTALQFGMKSCFHSQTEDVVIKISMGVFVQFLCSYVTLPLYALVTQMGSTMKSTIFNERVAMALRNWHHGAKKHVKQQNRRSQTQTPLSGPTTPDHSVSQAHLLRRWHSETDTYPTNSEAQHPYEIDLGPSSKVHHQEMEMDQLDHGPPENVNDRSQHEINIEHSKEFSFDNK
ncbi:MLO-like protein 6 isoform X1 [Vigna unguiculata]|uniref:MLO-like protein 6 isoform X1 n=2 Tax=Vigna unguiculata TaxID=3917 RepID=UPI001016F1A6|nr:MLO-like protein 6 isoform X1 [Vigna unguiculata]